MNYADLGKKVKEKYPQYQNLSDEELGKKVAEKYPQYQSQVGEGVVTSQEQKQSFVENVIKGDALPNVGQTIAGIASIPVTATLPPKVGKAVRTGIGALGRVGGEIVRQGFDPKSSSIGDASQIATGMILDLLKGKGVDFSRQYLSPEEQQSARFKTSKEGAKDQLGSLGEQAGIGLASEAAGEYVIGPLANKAIESILSPALAGSKNLIRKGAETIGEVVEKTPVIGGVKRWGATMIGKVKDSRMKERIANELLNIRPGNKIAKEAEKKLGVNLGKQFVEDVTKVSDKYGAEMLEKDLSGAVSKYKDEVVASAIDKATKESTQTVKLEGFIKEVEKKAKSLNLDKPGLGDEYQQEVLGWLERNTGVDFKTEISMKEAWEYRKRLDELVRTTTGNLPSSVDTSSAQKTAYNDIADALRKELNSDPTVEPFFREWQNFNAYSDQLAGRDVPRLPATISVLQNILKAGRDPQFLTKELLQEQATQSQRIPGRGKLEELLAIGGKLGKQQAGVGFTNLFGEE